LRETIPEAVPRISAKGVVHRGAGILPNAAAGEGPGFAKQRLVMHRIRDKRGSVQVVMITLGCRFPDLLGQMPGLVVAV
jgi:hypothetical protein